MKDLISIIIPVYNGEKYLKRCLKSLEKQSYKNFEVIIVDDGSKDKTNKICNDFVKKNNNFFYHYKDNSGVSDSRNFGISLAKGKWVTFIDCDDYATSDYLERLVENINKDSEFVISNYFVDREGQISECPVRMDNSVDKNNFIDLILCEKFASKEFNIMHKGARTVWGKLYKRDILKKNNIIFQKGIKLFEDGIFQIEYINHINNITITNYPIYYYFLNNESATHKYHPNRFDEDQNKIDYLNKILDKKNNESYNIFKFELLCSFTRTCLFHKSNTNNYFNKRKTLKNILKNNDYNISFNNISKYLSKPKKVFYILLKYKLVDVYMLLMIISRGIK